MKLLCDQDVPEPVVEPLAHLLRGRHKLVHVNHLRWKGKHDVFVLRDARAKRYDAILTNDAAQLSDADETYAIKRSGLHHIRYRHRHGGVAGLALAMSSIIASVPSILDELVTADGQRLVSMTAVSPSGRYTIVDPRRDPPTYWPR